MKKGQYTSVKKKWHQAVHRALQVIAPKCYDFGVMDKPQKTLSITPQATMFAVELHLDDASGSDDLFEAEKRAFETMREQLLSQY